MSCTQKQQLVCFPKVRVYKPWFRHFNDHKDFRNEGTVHLFSLMALFSYANFRSNERVINGDRYMEAPGQWICKIGALPRILRVHSKTQALELMEYFQNHGFLTFEILDEEKEILRFTIADWKEHCTHLQYNYYSYKGSGFFFFPLPVGRLLLKTARKEVGIVFSELDAIMDMWLHTILNDPKVRGSEYMPVVYYSNMRGMPLLSYTYLARRWGWSKSRVGRFMLKAGEYGISPITSTEFERRNLFYTKAGYKVIWVFDETEAYANEYIIGSGDNCDKFVWKWPNRAIASVVPQFTLDVAIIFQLIAEDDENDCDWLVKAEWAIAEDDTYADYRRFFIDDGFTPDLFSPTGLRDIMLNKRRRFEAFLRNHSPYEPKCKRMKGNPRSWYICEKTKEWHDDQCLGCRHNLITEYRKGTDYRRGGRFYYCCYPRVVNETDEYGNIQVPSIRNL